MKSALVIAVCLVLVAVVAAENAGRKRCRNSGDCEDDECCIGVAFLKGTCHERAEEGERCNADVVEPKGKYLVRCPCADGLKCVPEREEEGIFGKVRINERCTTGASPEPEITTDGEVSLEPEVELSTVIPEEE